MSTTNTQDLSLAERIDKLIESDSIELPPLPELALKLKEMLDRDTANAAQIAELIQSEPALATSVMRVANSTAFGGLSRVRELKQAIARLGMKQVSSIVTALLLKGHFLDSPQSKAEVLQRLWDHSIATAFCARQLAVKMDESADEAFMAGLVHDVGRLLVLKAVDLIESSGKSEISITDVVEEELMNTLHTTLGYKVLTQWRLPETICEVALHHEDEVDTSAAPLLTCVQAAEMITRKLGYHRNPDPELNLVAEPAIEATGISDVEMAELMVDLEDEFDEVQQLF